MFRLKKGFTVFVLVMLSSLLSAQSLKIVNLNTNAEYSELQNALNNVSSGDVLQIPSGEFSQDVETIGAINKTNRFYLKNVDNVSIIGAGYQDTVITNLSVDNCNDLKIENIQFRGGKTVNNLEGYSYPHSGLIVNNSEGFVLLSSAIIESGALSINGGGGHLLARNIISNYDYCLNLSVIDVKIYHNTIYASEQYGAIDNKHTNSVGGFFINAVNNGNVDIKNNLIYSGSKWLNSSGEWSEVSEPLNINVDTINIEGNVFAGIDSELPTDGVISGWTLNDEKLKNFFIKEPETLDLKDKGVIIPGFSDTLIINGSPDVGPREFSSEQAYVKAFGKDLNLNGEKFNFKSIAFTNFYYEDTLVQSVGGQFTNLKHHKQEDFNYVKELGFNSIRFALNGDWFKDVVTDNSEKLWDWLDSSISMAENANLLVILEMHIPPGESWLYSGNLYDFNSERWIWNSPAKQTKLIEIWTEIARRYQNNPTVAGYGLLNEPRTVTPGGDEWFGSNGGLNNDGLADRLINAVRSVDINHLILIDGATGTLDDQLQTDKFHKKFNDDNIMYDQHFYYHGSFTHKGAIWGGGQDNGSWYPDEYMVHDAGYINNRVADYAVIAKSQDQSYILNQWKNYETDVLDGGVAGSISPLFEVDAKRNAVISSEILFDNVVLWERKKGTLSWDLTDPNVQKVRECDVVGDWAQDYPNSTSDGFYVYDWQNDPACGEFLIAAEGSGDNISYGVKNISGGDYEHQAVNWEQSWLTNFKPKSDCEYKLSMDVKIKTADLGTSCNYFGPVIKIYKGGDYDSQGNFISNESGSIPKEWYGHNKDYLRRSMGIIEFGAEHNVPVSVFEFGLMENCYGNKSNGDNYGGSQWMSDVMEVFSDNNVSWAVWAYRNTPMGLFKHEVFDQYVDVNNITLRNDGIFDSVTDSFRQKKSRKVKEIAIDNSVGLYDVNRVPSQEPPLSLNPEQCPQFIIFGYDDNQFADGMRSILDVYKGITNPLGQGNPATYDGSPAKASFYMTPAGRDAATGETWEVDPGTVNSWREAYTQGHEIGNHTWFHEHGLQFSAARWKEEMTKTNNFLMGKLGMERSEITGFRTPFLEYNPNTYIALKELGFEYDNSFEGGWRYWPNEDGSTLYWPFTMDSGKPAGSEAKDFGIATGLWQMPTDCTFYDNAGQVARTTGFDYNIWFSAGATKAKFIEMLKFSLLKKYNGNRSPMNFGTHTNYYSHEGLAELEIYDPASVAKLNSTVEERTAAIKEFLEYAVTLPDVRVVTTQQALDWVKNPIPLGPATVKHNVMITNGLNGTVSPSGFVRVAEGENFTILLEPDAGFKVDSVTINSVPQTVTGNSVSLANLQDAAAVNVTFKEDPNAIVYTVSAPVTANGTVTPASKMVNKGQSATFTVIPDVNYTIGAASINGLATEVVDGKVTISNIQQDSVLNVVFSQIKITAIYTVTSDWGANFGGEIVISNTSSSPIAGWEVTLTYSGDQTVSGWNGVFAQVGNVVTITNPAWSGPLAPGASVKVGFNGSYTGTNSDPIVTVVDK